MLAYSTAIDTDWLGRGYLRRFVATNAERKSPAERAGLLLAAD
jgi:hypothetical protein